MAPDAKDLTQQMVQELFEYDPAGHLVHRIGPNAGKIACKMHKATGYRRVCIKGKSFRSHRIIFLLINGWVPEELDHKDRVRDNNKIDNLRPATDEQNGANRIAVIGSASRHKGVSHLQPKSDHWQASITANGEYERLGTFLTEDCAGAAYNDAAKRLHGDFAALNDVPDDHQPVRITMQAQRSLKKGTWSSSGYRGVYKVKGRNDKWAAAIRHNSETIHIAVCSSAEQAAAAYDLESIKRFGERAETNVKAGLLDPSVAYVPKGRAPKVYPKLAKTNTSGFKGVWCKKPGQWTASITLNRKRIHLGTHASAEIAARVYDAAAISARGPGATTNVSLGLLPDLLKNEKSEN